MDSRHTARLAWLTLLAGCSEADPSEAAPEAETAAQPAAVEEPEAEDAPVEPALTAPNPLRDVDLSDDRVAGMELSALWQLGVDALGWPAEMPAGTTKPEVHQMLLDDKYRGAGLPIGY